MCTIRTLECETLANQLIIWTASPVLSSFAGVVHPPLCAKIWPRRMPRQTPSWEPKPTWSALRIVNSHVGFSNTKAL